MWRESKIPGRCHVFDIFESDWARKGSRERACNKDRPDYSLGRKIFRRTGKKILGTGKVRYSFKPKGLIEYEKSDFI